MARVTVEFDSETPEGKRIVAAMAGAVVAVAAAPAAGESATPSKRSAKDKTAGEPAASAAAASTATASDAAAQTASQPEVTREELAAMIQAGVKNPNIGRAKIVAVLETFRPFVKAEHQKEPEIKLPMVPVEKRAALYAAVKALG